MAGVDEVVTDRVHEVKETRGTMRVPPGRGESIEVRDLGWGDLDTVFVELVVLRDEGGGSRGADVSDVDVSVAVTAGRTIEMAVSIDRSGQVDDAPH